MVYLILFYQKGNVNLLVDLFLKGRGILILYILFYLLHLFHASPIFGGFLSFFAVLWFHTFTWLPRPGDQIRNLEELHAIKKQGGAWLYISSSSRVSQIEYFQSTLYKTGLYFYFEIEI